MRKFIVTAAAALSVLSFWAMPVSAAENSAAEAGCCTGKVQCCDSEKKCEDCKDCCADKAQCCDTKEKC